MNIKENILRMKNVSELMIDLAYSALFLRDIEIAKEVESMYKELRLLEKDTLKLIFKIREPEEERIFMIDIMNTISGLAHSALRLADLTKSESYPSIIKDVLSITEKRTIVAKIAPHSIYANKTIEESAIKEKTGARIVGIKRNNKWFFKIEKTTRLLAGDEVLAVGSKKADELFKKYATGVKYV